MSADSVGMDLSHAVPSAVASPWLRLDAFLFRAIGAGQGPVWLMTSARLVARWSWLPLLALVAAVAAQAPAPGAPLALLALAFAGGLQLAGKRLARHWHSQRPFVLGLCANHLGHSARAGFPSSHALVMGAVIGVLIPHTANDVLLVTMAAIAALTGWARVHTGAHFPLDVIVGTVAGLFAGFLFGLMLPF